MTTEFFDVVDDKDNVLGRRPGRECLMHGLLHRAVAILLFDERGRIFIQRRARTMGWYPGHWTLSVTGHVSAGETYEQAAKREMHEELGISCDLKPVVKVKTPDWPYGEMLEREYLKIFKGYVTSPKIRLSAETSEGKFVPFDEFLAVASREPHSLTPDTLLALEEYTR